MSKGNDTQEIVDTLNLIVERMATKEDLAELRTEMHEGFVSIRAEMNEGFASIRAEIRDIRQRLDVIETELKNHTGFAKEIDYLMERVQVIEKHLGIQRKITT